MDAKEAQSTYCQGMQPAIKWAAFYSDCEHEVYEVTRGHRLTLTYNLYVTRGQGHLAGSASMLDSTQLPLYDNLKLALDTPGFLRRGKVLDLCFCITSITDMQRRSYPRSMAHTQLRTHSQACQFLAKFAERS